MGSMLDTMQMRRKSIIRLLLIYCSIHKMTFLPIPDAYVMSGHDSLAQRRASGFGMVERDEGGLVTGLE